MFQIIVVYIVTPLLYIVMREQSEKEM